MCRPTGNVVGNTNKATTTTTTSLQEEQKEMESIQKQLQKLIGFNPIVVTSRRPSIISRKKRCRPSTSSSATGAAFTTAAVTSTYTDKKVVTTVPEEEWILWEHKLVASANNNSNNAHESDQPPQHVERQDWQSQSSEVAHFFHSSTNSCDTTHVPSPSKTFTPPTPKCQQRKPIQNHVTNNNEQTKRGYSLFKHGVLPEWEDPLNQKGGCWFIRQYIEPTILDTYWKNLIAGLVDQKTFTSLSESKKNVWKPKHLRAKALAMAKKKQQQQETTDHKEMFLKHINGIRIDDKTHPYSQRAMYKIEIWIDTTDTTVCEHIRSWMLSTMMVGSNNNTSTKKSTVRSLRTHWKSFATKMVCRDNEEEENKSIGTLTTMDSNSSASSSSSSFSSKES